MQKTCAQCGKSFDARSPRALYCSQACRQAALRARKAELKKPQLSVMDGSGGTVVQMGDRKLSKPDPVTDGQTDDGLPPILGVVKGRLADLSDADWRKAVALRLAYRLDHSEMDTATAIANLSAALEKLMDEIAPADGEDDFLDSLTGRVGAKRRRR